MTKTATVSLHANNYEVDAALVGRKVELVFDPFDLTRIEVRYQHRPFGPAVPLVIGRQHPSASRSASCRRHRRRPGSTTCGCWPSSATPSWAGSGSTTHASPSPSPSPSAEPGDGES